MYIIIYGILYGAFELNIFDSFRTVLIVNSIVPRMHFTSDSDPPSTLSVFLLNESLLSRIKLYCITLYLVG